MMGISVWKLLIILAIVIVLFGTGRLSGIGFITLSGVAVLTGLVIVSCIRDLRAQGMAVLPRNSASNP